MPAPKKSTRSSPSRSSSRPKAPSSKGSGSRSSYSSRESRSSDSSAKKDFGGKKDFGFKKSSGFKKDSDSKKESGFQRNSRFSSEIRGAKSKVGGSTHRGLEARKSPAAPEKRVSQGEPVSGRGGIELGSKPTRRPSDSRTTKAPNPHLVWGRRPVESALTHLQSQGQVNHGDYTLHVIVDKLGKAPAQLRSHVELAQSLGIPVKTHSSMEGEWPLQTAEPLNHQRVCLRVPEIKAASLEDLMAWVDSQESLPHKCLGVICDQINDPGNFGAIARTASFFGAHFLVFATDRQAPLSPHMVRSSAGGVFELLMVETVNLSRALDQLKDRGIWVVSSSLGSGTIPLSQVPLDRPYVVIVGNEEKGVRAGLLQHSDYQVNIPGGNSLVDSLNVSVATGILLAHFQPK